MKDPGQRRRYNQPVRGEWVDLKPLEAPVLGPFRPSFTLPRELWEGWRADPVSSQWGPADIGFAIATARDWAFLAHAEQSKRASYLGLTPKGKRDLRWRTPNEVKTIAEQPPAPVKRLRAVLPDQPPPDFAVSEKDAG